MVHAAPPSPLLVVPNVIAHPLTASVPITVLLYNGPLHCGFNVPVKGLRKQKSRDLDVLRDRLQSDVPTSHERSVWSVVWWSASLQSYIMDTL